MQPGFSVEYVAVVVLLLFPKAGDGGDTILPGGTLIGGRLTRTQPSPIEGAA